MPDDEFPDLGNLKAALAALVEAHSDVQNIRDQLDLAGSDTVFAIGEAAGILNKAMALLNRDIAAWTPVKLPPLRPLASFLSDRDLEFGAN